MARRGLTVIFFACTIASASAQTYQTPHPVPHTTDPTLLHAYAKRMQLDLRFTRGLDAEDRGDWSAAADNFEHILKLNPPEPQGSTARYDLALAYTHANRWDEAAAQLRDALRLDSGFLAAMANLIAIDLHRGDLREARAIADDYVKNAPESARALYSRGLVALQSNDARTAEQDFGQLLKANPSAAVAHYDLGIAESNLGRENDARREFEAALSLSPTYARARFALGTVLLRQGDRTDARAAFAQAARDAGDDSSLASLAVAMRDAIRN